MRAKSSSMSLQRSGVAGTTVIGFCSDGMLVISVRAVITVTVHAALPPIALPPAHHTAPPRLAAPAHELAHHETAGRAKHGSVAFPPYKARCRHAPQPS